jgi:hypothetical protein
MNCLSTLVANFVRSAERSGLIGSLDDCKRYSPVKQCFRKSGFSTAC